MSVTPVILPKLGLTMDEGTLVAWLKQEGDRVEAGEVLFEVETDKATMEVESPVAGYVRRLLAAAGDTVPVTEVIALITTTADEPFTVPSTPVELERPAAVEAPPPAPTAPRLEDERVIASPAARKRAAELGVDLARVRPARGGRISVEDVETVHAAGGPGEGPVAPGGAAVRAPLSRMRRAIAERMTQSFRDVPQFSVSRDVDMTAAAAARTTAGVSFADVLIWAVARSLADHPRLAMRYDPEGLIPPDGIHIGIAVALDDGLLVPVLRDAGAKELAAISRERVALQDGARAGKLPVEALVGAVFTISNLGPQSVDRFTAIVNPPEAAILAVGRVRDLVVARDGAVVIAPTVTLTLSVDHRVVDGAQAAAFLADLAGRLEGGLP
ncbi:MAG: 2-oxo acid dehydrogenase subunit E2 [Chloroflexi bacterium]|nr:2-oxo acid dehydrogenase subunit E2 [Chloroflexota bacterium]